MDKSLYRKHRKYRAVQLNTLYLDEGADWREGNHALVALNRL